MRKLYSCPRFRLLFTLFLVFVVPLVFLQDSVRALTASIGHPYHGRLVNGIPFPNQFRGYQLRDEERVHTTPEVIGALLDAIDGVQAKYPSSCDLYLGDFSRPGGGFMNHHRSHQNGKDVDIGMYARENRPLDSFIPMNEENLDIPKTWCLIEGILRSQRVQYIFLDKRIQELLYDYAMSRGADATYLDRLFGNGRGATIQHVRNHVDHMHVRFYTPWSTLAAQVNEADEQKLAVVEMAQQAYLPKKVQYYAKGTERSLDALAQSFGVNNKDLCRWNQLHGSDVLTPGSCIVFYKRGFELEPVHLAQSLQPSSISEAPPLQLASLRPTRSVLDAPVSVRDSGSKDRDRSPESTPAPTCTSKRGDTLEKIAKRNGVNIKVLCRLNGMNKGQSLKPGQKIILADAVSAGGPSGSSKSPKSSRAQPTTVSATRGDTLAKIAKRSGLSVDALASLNGLKKNAALKPGQTIKLAVKESASPNDVPAFPPIPKSPSVSLKSVVKVAPQANKTILKNQAPPAKVTAKDIRATGATNTQPGAKAAQANIPGKMSGSSATIAKKPDLKAASGKTAPPSSPSANSPPKKTTNLKPAPVKPEPVSKVEKPKGVAKSTQASPKRM